MKLHTERLNLREIVIADLEAVHALHSIPEIDRYNTQGIPRDLTATREILQGWLDGRKTEPVQLYTFVMEDKNGVFAGLIGIKIGAPKRRVAEIWYKVDLGQWNKGLATEAVKEILRFCFAELDLHRVEAGCVTGNTASARVLLKAGMLQEGVKRKAIPIRGEWMDGNTYAILEEEYRNAL